MIKNKIIDAIRNKRASIPTLPAVITNILSLIKNENSSASDLASAIGHDQAISSRMLRIANSAYYGLSHKVDTITRSIVVIGFNEVMGLIIGSDVFSAISKKKGNGLINMDELWTHSIEVGITATKIERKIGAVSKESTFLSGIIHDIGKVFLSVNFPEEYKIVLEKAKKTQLPLHDVEKEMLGIDHADLANYLMEIWNFPENLVLTIAYHHNFKACPEVYKEKAMIIYLANLICKNANSDCLTMKIDEDVLSELGLTIRDNQDLEDHLIKERSNIEDFKML